MNGLVRRYYCSVAYLFCKAGKAPGKTDIFGRPEKRPKAGEAGKRMGLFVTGKLGRHNAGLYRPLQAFMHVSRDDDANVSCRPNNLQSL